MPFKHRGFREEREARIVAIPGTKMLAEQVKREHKDYTPSPLKQTLPRKNEDDKRRIVLFENLNVTLPIKRIIVGPARNQGENYKKAKQLFDTCEIISSKTPFIG